MIAAVMMSSAAFAQDNQEKKCCELKKITQKCKSCYNCNKQHIYFS